MRVEAGGFPLLCPQLLSVSSPAGLMDSEVTQTPKYLIKSRKQQATQRCSPESGHRSVYWYQQALGQGPQFLIQYYTGKLVRNETYQIDSQENSSVIFARG